MLASIEPFPALMGAIFLALAGAALAVWGALRARGARREERVARARVEALAAGGDGILVVDGEGRIVEAAGPAAEALLAASVSEGARLPAVVDKGLEKSSTRHVRVKAGSDQLLEVWTGDYSSGSSDGELRGLLVRDITQQYRDERNLMRLAHYDSLTGLANRRLFLENLKSDLAKASVSGSYAALLYIDLDHFKEVNDSLGHAAGDALLQALAKRFLEELRPAGGGESGVPHGARVRVARLSGDEFAVVASPIPDAEAARELAQCILRLVAMPIELQQRSVTSSASIGIAVFPKDGDDVATLIHSADAAVYSAKNKGRHRAAFYEPTIDAGRERTGLIAHALQEALERSELRLHYQPKVAVASGAAVGFEALLRWTSPELGVVAPKEFIPVAEDRGLIVEIGAWCLQEACRQIRLWREAGFTPVPVSVNVSSVQFKDNDLQRVVCEALKEHEVEPELLEIELTESLLLDGGESTTLCLRDLRTIGVGISLDDFGTGYSALSYLNQFPLDVLKMDRGFLREIHLDDSAARLAGAIVSMAHSLGLCVVAEGVDSQEQLAILRDMECDQIQGFLYSPAIPPEEAQRLLAAPGSSAPQVPIVTLQPGRIEVDDAADCEATEPVPVGELPGSTARPQQKVESSTLLLLDDGEASLQPLTERLVRLGGIGIDLHYASAPDEACLLLEQEGSRLCAIAVPPSIDLDDAHAIRLKCRETRGALPALVVLGEQPEEPVRARLREIGVTSVLWTPFDDTELAFILKAALASPADLARRSNIRVPVDLTARVQAGQRREIVVLSSLSSRGAFLEMSDPLPTGTQMRVEFELPTDAFRVFARVVHQSEDDPDCPFTNSGVGIVFYGIDRDADARLCKAIEERAARYLP